MQDSGADSPMLRFSANLGFLWSELPLLDRIERAAAAGFRAIELHWPYDTPPEEVRDACHRHGLTLVGLNTVVGNAASGDFGLGAVPGREADFMAAIEQSIDYCQVSGARAIHAMAGNVPASQRSQAREVFTANLARAAERAEENDLTLLLEPINASDKPDYFLSTLQEAEALIEAVGSGRIRIMFDVYHVARQEGDVLRKLERYRHRIGHVQVAAVPSRAEPDEGEICYRAIFAQLRDMDYSGFVGCEYIPRASVEEGLKWMDVLRPGKNALK